MNIFLVIKNIDFYNLSNFYVFFIHYCWREKIIKKSDFCCCITKVKLA